MTWTTTSQTTMVAEAREQQGLQNLRKEGHPKYTAGWDFFPHNHVFSLTASLMYSSKLPNVFVQIAERQKNNTISFVSHSHSHKRKYCILLRYTISNLTYHLLKFTSFV